MNSIAMTDFYLKLLIVHVLWVENHKFQTLSKFNLSWELDVVFILSNNKPNYQQIALQVGQ